jgi:hypothetical protein
MLPSNSLYSHTEKDDLGIPAMLEDGKFTLLVVPEEVHTSAPLPTHIYRKNFYRCPFRLSKGSRHVDVTLSKGLLNFPRDGVM